MTTTFETGPARRPRVYVVQQALTWNSSTGRMEPKYPSVTKAEEYGDLVYLLGANAAPFQPRGVIAELHEKLRHIDPEDYLLLVGNPALIGFAVTIATDYTGGQIKLLQWGSGRYTPIEADLFPSDDE